MAKRILVILMALFVVFAVVSCKEPTPPAPTAVAVTGVTLDETSITLEVGGTKTLTPTVTPDDATNKTLIWGSRDDTVATVADGVVTAVSPGETTIIVTTVDGGITAECSVVVNTPGNLTLSGNITIAPVGPVEINNELSATYSGSESVSYQWRKDGDDIASATTTKYTPTEVGIYTVRVSLTGYNPKISTGVTVTPALFVFPLGAFSDNTKTWNTNGVDDVTNEFTEEILAAAKYLIVKAHTDILNGTGGMQIQIQGSGTGWEIGETDLTPGWTNLQPLDTYGTNMDFFIVIELSTLDKWSELIGGNAKIVLSWPVGWTDSNFDFVAGYLTNKTLVKPSTKFVNVTNGTKTYGWFAPNVPEM